MAYFDHGAAAELFPGGQKTRTGAGNPIPKNKETLVRPNPVPTDTEIDSAVERLGPNWARAVPRARTAGASHIVQSLARGRSHAVVLEIKRLPRRIGGSS